MSDMIGAYDRINRVYRMYIESAFPFRYSVLNEERKRLLARRGTLSQLPVVETVADYEYVRIGGAQQFLLPVHSETLSCQRGTNYCSRNAIDFRNYKKYSGEATITFDNK